jgi:predicted  nucleic acid-binding Zn-ribbon protein
MTDTLLQRLRAAQRHPVPSVLLIREAAEEIERLQRQVAQLRRDIRENERDVREERRGAAVEASWQERQGDDYGSY